MPRLHPRDRQDVESLHVGRRQDGWSNRCCRPVGPNPWNLCGLAYWVRAIDVQAQHARRFAGPDTSELHQCRKVQPE